MLLLTLLLSGSVLCLGQGHQQITWGTYGFNAFRSGTFDSSGANLYVSRKGILQTVDRFDVNNDGYYDLIFSDTHDLNYVLPAFEYDFEGGRFRPRRIEFPGVGSVRVAATDLNGDGKPDLVIARGFDDTTYVQNSWIYWGGEGGWSRRRHTELPTPYVRDVCIGDFNHDGHSDLAFISGTPGTEQAQAAGSNVSLIYWGRPDGYLYRDRIDFETPGANGCLAADFDGDGYTDLLVMAPDRRSKVYWGGRHGISSQASTSLPIDSVRGAAQMGSRIILATAKGVEVATLARRSFALQQTIPFSGAGRLTVADLNHDGIPDLVVTREVHDQNWETTSRIFWGKRQGSRVVFSESDHTDLPTLGAADVAVGDLDGDGYPDIVFANNRSHLSFDVPSYIYWGGPHGYSVAHRTELPTHGARSVSILGRDVFFANSVSGRATGDIDSQIFFGDKQGDYSVHRMQQLPTVGAYEACVADLNDDGYPDVVFTNSHEGDTTSSIGSYIYWGGKDGLSASRRTVIPTRGAMGCAIDDLNQDGYLDLVFTNLDDDTMQIFYGGPNGFDPRRQTILHVKDARFPAIADLNKDGYLDLIVPSVSTGLHIFWGSATGYSQQKQTVLPAVGPVSEQIADLNGDGYLDIVVCDLVDLERWKYHGINSLIYWGSPQGYSPYDRTELPSLGAEHATIADFNRDGHLDIFISNYQSELTRDLDSYIYWGNREADYTASSRQALHVGSAAGIVSADLNGDGWIDLAVANHVQHGTHYTKSWIFWNGPKGFNQRDVTRLPTVGPHMMTGVDQGNIYTRALHEIYTSRSYDAGKPVTPLELDWEGTTHFGSRLGFELRGANSQDDLKSMPWKSLGFHTEDQERIDIDALQAKRWWQYRVILSDGRASSPTVKRVTVTFRPTTN